MVDRKDVIMADVKAYKTAEKTVEWLEKNWVGMLDCEKGNL